ncbi:MAG TPA: hypothetical protein VEA44_18715 [Caulobacter sp.]|nr:hypothetical protein [Caulobacter sp.]
MELFRASNEHRANPLNAQLLAEATDTPALARVSQRRLRGSAFSTEADRVNFLEAAFEVLEDLGGDELSNTFFNRIQRFIDKYSLRYDLRRPFSLHPTLAGVFSGMVRELKSIAAADAALLPILRDFEESVRDLRVDSSERNIKTCIQKQVNLLEALGQGHPNAAGANTLGRISDNIGTWPHEQVKEAIKNLYRFTCDYPGIRHAGTAANQLRPLGMTDLVAISAVLAGFAPYLADALDASAVYRR